MAEESQESLEAALEQLTQQLMTAWMQGLCDGFEHCSRIVEKMVERFPDTNELAMTAAAIRQVQVALLVDGIQLGANDGN